MQFFNICYIQNVPIDHLSTHIYFATVMSFCEVCLDFKNISGTLLCLTSYYHMHACMLRRSVREATLYYAKKKIQESHTQTKYRYPLTLLKLLLKYR